MRFKALSDEELNKPLYDAGIYNFKIIQAYEKPSKAGNEMLVIELLIEASNGGNFIVKDYLLSTETSIWKISQLCKSINKEGLYKTENMEPFDIVNCNGTAELQHQTNPNDGKKYLRVKRYLAHKEKEIQQTEHSNEMNDEIPF
jgi:hypothetical protein